MISGDVGLEDLIRAAVAGPVAWAADGAAAGAAAGEAAGAAGPTNADEAVAKLLSRLYPDLLGYALRLTLRKDLAEDVCQDTMVKVITGLSRYRLIEGRVTEGFRGWVLSIATNVYRDILRKSARMVLTADVGQEQSIVDEGADLGAASVEDLALERVQTSAVLDALKTLPHEQRTSFILRTYYGFSYKDVGEISGCPEGTAKSRTHKAILALRDELKRRGML